jgi:hypothetical protein
MRRYIRQPTQATPVRLFPISLSVMRFRAGYRGKLWAHGLRGSLPGALLDGGLGFGIGVLIFWLGLLFAPGRSWGFFQDFSSFSWLTVLDGLLVALLRPFFLAIALFGFGLPYVLGIWFAMCGFFTGLRKGHTTFSDAQDKRHHQIWGRWLVLGLWAAAGGMVALLLNTPTYPAPLDVSSLGIAHPIHVTAFFVSRLGLSLIRSSFFDPLAILMPGIFAFTAMRIVIALRNRLYARIEKRWGNLLRPVGRG